MKRLFTIIITLIVMATVHNTMFAAVNEEVKAQSEKYVQLLERGNWMIIPKQANFPKTITLHDMNEDTNYFRYINDTLTTRIDFIGCRATHALSEEQLYWLAAENVELWRLLESAPPFFMSQYNTVKKEIKVSKNYKTVTMELRCKVCNKNFEDYNTMPSFTISVDVKSGLAYITCRGMHYDESFNGPIYEVVLEQ